MAKYIIDLPENTHWIQWILESAEDHHPYMDYKQVEYLTPYTEPNLEQVRKEAFKNGYDTACKDIDIKSKTNAAYRKGLEDAWNAARTIIKLEWEEKNKIFGKLILLSNIFSDNTAAEAIEKLKQYEKEQEGFHVGDEFENETGKKFVVLKVNGKEIDRYIDSDGQTYHMNVRYRVMHKTGRHFPEITTFFEKMRGEQDG